MGVPGYLSAVGLHGLVEHLLQAFDLVVDALLHVAVAIIVDQGTLHADVLGVAARCGMRRSRRP